MNVANLMSVFGMDGRNRQEQRGSFVMLTDELERNGCMEGNGCDYDRVLDSVLKLRRMARDGRLQLSRAQKTRALKMINVVKVRALLHGTMDGMDTFRKLDSVSSDLSREL